MRGGLRASMVAPKTTPRLFKTREAFRAWLAKNHDKKGEIWLRYHKAGSGKTSVVYKEALDEALCFGWIDGVVKGIDDASYIQRWSPRKKGSYWSAVNIKKAEALIAQGRMTPAGLAAFAARDKSAKARYSFENRPQDLPPAALARLKGNKAAWAFWQEQPPGYRRTATWLVVSAKKDETRAKRLELLIECSARGERLPALVSPARAKKTAAPRAGSRGR